MGRHDGIVVHPQSRVAAFTHERYVVVGAVVELSTRLDQSLPTIPYVVTRHHMTVHLVTTNVSIATSYPFLWCFFKSVSITVSMVTAVSIVTAVSMVTAFLFYAKIHPCYATISFIVTTHLKCHAISKTTSRS